MYAPSAASATVRRAESALPRQRGTTTAIPGITHCHRPRRQLAAPDAAYMAPPAEAMRGGRCRTRMAIVLRRRRIPLSTQPGRRTDQGCNDARDRGRAGDFARRRRGVPGGLVLSTEAPGAPRWLAVASGPVRQQDAHHDRALKAVPSTPGRPKHRACAINADLGQVSPIQQPGRGQPAPNRPIAQ